MSLAVQQYEALVELQQLDEMEAMLLKKPYTNTQLAAELDIPLGMVAKMRSRVESRWKKKQRNRLDDFRRLRVRQLEDLYERALEAFEESQRDRTLIKKKVRSACDVCHGIGIHAGDYCGVCDGDGEIEKEVEEVVVEYIPGNPTFLQNAHKILGELAKIEGLVVRDKHEVNQSLTVNSTVLAHTFVSGDNPFRDASTDDLHKALAAIHNLKQSQKNAQSGESVIEGEVVDGESAD